MRHEQCQNIVNTFINLSTTVIPLTRFRFSALMQGECKAQSLIRSESAGDPLALG